MNLILDVLWRIFKLVGNNTLKYCGYLCWRVEFWVVLFPFLILTCSWSWPRYCYMCSQYFIMQTLVTAFRLMKKKRHRCKKYYQKAVNISWKVDEVQVELLWNQAIIAFKIPGCIHSSETACGVCGFRDLCACHGGCRAAMCECNGMESGVLTGGICDLLDGGAFWPRKQEEKLQLHEAYSCFWD